jgi:tripeptidyl-peptidase-2
MCLSRIVLTLLLIILSISCLIAEDWNFLDIDRIGARSFIKSNPQYDGRNTIIIILDTGIDMGVSGLDKLPNGESKVIDVQDFSGEGDVFLEEAVIGSENNEKYLANPDSIKLFGIDKIAHTPVDSIYYIGVLKESKFVNSVIPDLNNNNETNDQFGIAVFNTINDGWLAYIDLDGDGNLDDEKPIWNYKEKLQSFQFRGRNKERNRNLVNLALNIFPDENRINFHFDGNGHGSHCAGIAAGYKINGQDGLDGVAPGAKLISLKIGDGSLSGGATVTGSMISAYEYGVEFAKNYDGPVVFSMSYGVGSEIEGMADMDIMLDDLATANENLLFVTSAGNEGPGISTVGLPAAAKRILTVGAIYTPKIANSLYGSTITNDIITSFSSRGGEIHKPDVLTPGAASSTIPPYSNRDIKGGTSMACPQAAGAVALIMSAAVQQNSPLSIVGSLIKKAIRYSADPLPDYLPLEQGGGVINVARAFEFYKSYIKANDHSEILDYNIDTISPAYKIESGQTAYWRFGDYSPTADDEQRFYINPVFPKSKNADQRHNFYRGFDLVTSDPWIILKKSSTYIKGDNAATVDVYFKQSELQQPGIYSGKVTAYNKGGFLSGHKPINTEFELLCTIIKPITFNEANSHQWNSDKIQLEPGQIYRIFYKIPLMASAGIIKLNAVDTKYANVHGNLFDPSGRENAQYIRLDTNEKNNLQIRLSNGELEEGIWEFVLYSDIRNTKKSTVQVEISFSGLESIPNRINSVQIENGSNPKGRFDVLNHYNKKIEANVNGQIMGIQRVKYLEESSDKYEYYFSVGQLYEKVEFELELTPQVFNMFTDFAVNIKDYSGKILKSDGFTYRKLKISWLPPISGDYILEFLPGFAKKEPRPWQVSLKESFYLFNKINIESSRYSFYPDMKKGVDFTIYGVLSVAPEDFYLFGEIWLDETNKNYFRHIVPVMLYTGLNN